MRMCVYLKQMFVLVFVTQCVQCLLSIGMERRVFVQHSIRAQIFMVMCFCWELLFNREMKQKRMEKDIKTNDDKQIFLEHT